VFEFAAFFHDLSVPRWLESEASGSCLCLRRKRARSCQGQ
jgi:hypothetical protein